MAVVASRTPSLFVACQVQFAFPPLGTFLDSAAFARDTTFRTYDQAGNVADGWERARGTKYRKVQTRSYYGADDKLRAQQGYHELGGMYFTGERRGYFSEYRYDARGRRILVRTRRNGLCNTSQSTVDCTSGIERFVYAGDNVLWEMRGPGSASSTPAELDQEVGTGQEYGAIGYTHAGGVDRPLAAYKRGVNAAVIAPHTNWRGQFSGGTYLQGSQSTFFLVLNLLYVLRDSLQVRATSGDQDDALAAEVTLTGMVLRVILLLVVIQSFRAEAPEQDAAEQASRPPR